MQLSQEKDTETAILQKTLQEKEKRMDLMRFELDE